MIVLLVLLLLPTSPVRAQDYDPSLWQDLEWRMIGPFRAGRTVGATGVPGWPGLFYVGLNNGGVWKTDDYGRTWVPIFDDESTGSIGDLAVAPSDPDILYVGTGEGLHRPDLAIGDGMFRSDDAGRTWQHVGLSDAQQVASIVVHPDNPDRVWVAVLGHPYGPNEERGVYRTDDGGASWERVLFVDHNTGAIQVALDPGNPDVVYADLWAHREGPWENANWSGETSGLFKSTDGGTTWRQLSGGLPGVDEGLGRIGIGIAPSEPDRIFATVDARRDGGIYRSDDGGENWRLVSTDRRVWGRGGDFGEIKVHPTNPDVVFAGNVASYRSDDGGATWWSPKGAPGGDDYHRIWIDPDNPDIMIFGADQGATITVNGGRTWSSWYNQPTAQLYHVSTDNAFPYRVYGGQQESGAIAIASRGPGGQISFREFEGVGADEYAYVAPDPLNPDIVYGGRVVRFDRRTGQSANVAPEAVRSGRYRTLRTMPLLFHHADPATLLYATNVLWKTTTGGQSWQPISPDLSRERPEVPASIGDFATPDLEDMPRRGVIYAVGPSYLRSSVIWAGTDDGLVHVTLDGGATWSDVTPPEVGAWDKITQIDAGHYDLGTAYVAVNAIRKDDRRPHIFRTHDGGATWVRIVDGLPERGPVNVVREDPVRPGLLYAGTERSVFVSFDDGDSWIPLQMNMPATSIRDLVLKDDDLVVGTHGRSIWILDNVTPLRQIDSALQARDAYLYRPQPATRVRWNRFSDTPIPPEEPMGQNPPDGAIIDYFLDSTVSEIRLDILDDEGHLLRTFSSSDVPERLDSTLLPHPTFWVRPPEVLETGPGMHRFVWDLHLPPPSGAEREYPIAAVRENTPSVPVGPWVLPGAYSVRLSMDGFTSEQSLLVRMDPTVPALPDVLRDQYDLSLICYGAYHETQELRELILSLVGSMRGISGRPEAAGLQADIEGIAGSLEALAGGGNPTAPDLLYGASYVEPEGEESLVHTQTTLLYLMTILQGADVVPTSQVVAAVRSTRSVVDALFSRWETVRDGDLDALDRALRERGLPGVLSR